MDVALGVGAGCRYSATGATAPIDSGAILALIVSILFDTGCNHGVWPSLASWMKR